ncbi:S-adenosyl-L-methionine-dependent methyltransferase [Desarmillaria tabescens]|uniref:S-adenosyl-L-methionine-dependent methyltransferase n=1 Tax=Armillaria tabescens TaxID=1929756 RepID=A0AA39TQL6_ARMTA|nr:S-adenosyl-L-methionine-dependent methyltransferase [Desarmillaria tabescens]KAK0467082.1 S-adenosyl-L-methionine-dependent methyltransferase [Desarmillaria tabescens]
MFSSSTRVYPSATGVHYILPSDTLERRRLDLQHSFLSRALCDSKSVLAPITLKPSDKVLDSGTGSGAWALSLAEEVPASVSIDAFDIQSNIFPESFPPNIHFSLHSVTNLPGEWSDTYSLVNQRFLFTALTEPQWKAALLEIFRVLAPGGWVQLVESSPLMKNMGEYTQKMQKLLIELFAYKKLVTDVPERLPDMLTQQGFVNIHSETRALPLGAWAGLDGTQHRDNLIGVFSALHGPILQSGGFEPMLSKEDFDKFLTTLAKEWDNGEEAFASHSWTVVYAQKVRGVPTMRNDHVRLIIYHAESLLRNLSLHFLRGNNRFLFYLCIKLTSSHQSNYIRQQRRTPIY